MPENIIISSYNRFAAECSHALVTFSYGMPFDEYLLFDCNVNPQWNVLQWIKLLLYLLPLFNHYKAARCIVCGIELIIMILESHFQASFWLFRISKWKPSIKRLLAVTKYYLQNYTLNKKMIHQWLIPMVSRLIYSTFIVIHPTKLIYRFISFIVLG